MSSFFQFVFWGQGFKVSTFCHCFGVDGRVWGEGTKRFLYNLHIEEKTSRSWSLLWGLRHQTPVAMTSTSSPGVPKPPVIPVCLSLPLLDNNVARRLKCKCEQFSDNPVPCTCLQVSLFYWIGIRWYDRSPRPPGLPCPYPWLNLMLVPKYWWDPSVSNRLPHCWHTENKQNTISTFRWLIHCMTNNKCLLFANGPLHK